MSRNLCLPTIIALASCLAAGPAHAEDGGCITWGIPIDLNSNTYVTAAAPLIPAANATGALVIGSAGGTIDVNGLNVTINAGIFHEPSVAGAEGGLTIQSARGNGTLVLNALRQNAANDAAAAINQNTYSGYTGSTTVNAGTLTLVSNPIRIATPIVSSGTLNVSTVGSISGGRLTLGQPGTLTLVGTNIGQLTPVIVNTGTIAGGIGATFKANSSATWSSAPTASVLTVSAGNISLVRDAGSRGPMGPFLSPPSSTWSTTSGPTGLGTLTLGGTNSYRGGTLVTAGTLAVNNLTGGTTLAEITFAGPGLPSATGTSVPFGPSLSPGSTSAFTLTAVPEPSSLLLGVLALAVLVAAHRARQRVSSPLRSS